MIMFKLNCQAKTIASALSYVQQGSNTIDLPMGLFFQQFAVSQAFIISVQFHFW